MLLGTLLMSRCTEKIDLKLDNAAPQLVVDAQLSDTGYQYVYLSQSMSYYQPDSMQGISGAQVGLSIDNVNTFLSFEEIKKGVYKSRNTWQAQAESCFSLHIDLKEKINGHQNYSAQGCATKKIDLEGVHIEKTDDILNKSSYIVGVDFKDPAGSSNYYLFRAYKNGLSITPAFDDVSMIDDRSLDGQTLKNLKVLYIDTDANPEYTLKVGDTLKVEMGSITKDYFDFLSALRRLSSNQNPLFGGPPANAPCNISPAGVGYFAVSRLSTYQHIVSQEDLDGNEK